MQKLKRIIINGKTYPMKMDLNVLETIQNEYGTINEFERDILGLKFAKDADGKQLFNDEGEPKMIIGETSIRAIKVALPAMINEGLEIEAEEAGKEFELVEESYIFRNCNVSYELLGKMIHEEFKRCFKVKK